MQATALRLSLNPILLAEFRPAGCMARRARNAHGRLLAAGEHPLSPEGLALSTDTPCTLLLSHVDDGALLAVSKPGTADGEMVEIRINRKLSGDSARWIGDEGNSLITSFGWQAQAKLGPVFRGNLS